MLEPADVEEEGKLDKNLSHDPLIPREISECPFRVKDGKVYVIGRCSTMKKHSSPMGRNGEFSHGN